MKKHAKCVLNVWKFLSSIKSALITYSYIGVNYQWFYLFCINEGLNFSICVLHQFADTKAVCDKQVFTSSNAKRYTHAHWYEFLLQLLTGCWMLMTQRKSCDNPGTNIKYKTILVLLLDFWYKLCTYSDTKDILLPPFLQGCAIRVQDFSHGSSKNLYVQSTNHNILYKSKQSNQNYLICALEKISSETRQYGYQWTPLDPHFQDLTFWADSGPPGHWGHRG